MMKKILYLMILFLASCTIFSEQDRLITTKKSPLGIMVKLYYVELGATTNDVIQVRKVDKNNEEVLLGAYEHNFVKSSNFISEDSLQLILADTSYYGISKKSDTIVIRIK